MEKKRNVWNVLLDVIEVYIPSVAFIVLFIAFLFGIIFRYVLKDPQTWTFEVSRISFLWAAILAACIADRDENHVIFDMIYVKTSLKVQCLMRIISNLLIIVFISWLTPFTVQYLMKMNTQPTSILKIPMSLVFIPFLVLFICTIVRALHRLILDIQAFRKKTYVQTYNRKEGAS